MYTEFIEQPLHNLILWLISLTPGNSLVLGLFLLALVTKLIMFVFIYHGHINGLTHHHIKKHTDNLHRRYHNKKDKFAEEIHNLYEHYRFNPWKGLWITFTQFIILFGILDFLYVDISNHFQRLDLVIAENIFIPTVIDFHLGTINLLVPLERFWALAILAIVQFLYLEIYLLSKKKLYKSTKHEEATEHILNIIITGVVLIFAFKLPGALALYWFFFLLIGILQRVMFDSYLDHKIISKLEKLEKDFVKKENKNIKKIDEGLLFLLWKLFHPKTKDKNYHDMRKDLKKKIYVLHHKTHLHSSQKKIIEEPFLIAFLIFLA